jgi:hypothetical protein
MKFVNRDNVFSTEARAELLSRYQAALDRMIDADLSGKIDKEATEEVSRLWDQYLEGTPVVEISRNPYTGAVFSFPIDTMGLDGLWWDYDGPARRVSRLPSGVHAFTGAVSLREPVENVPFLCRPGPGRPFVIPRILERDGVTAVVSRAPIGRHDAWAIVYFREDCEAPVPRFNTWGMNHAAFTSRSGGYGWYECETRPEDFDYDLSPWLNSGKLLWIEDGDEGLFPRKGVEGCPFIALKGEKLLQLTEGGKVWTEEPYVFDDPGDPVIKTEAVQVEELPQEPQTQPKPVNPEPEPQAKPKSIFCGNCGKQMAAEAVFCGSCGTPTKK